MFSLFVPQPGAGKTIAFAVAFSAAFSLSQGQSYQVSRQIYPAEYVVEQVVEDRVTVETSASITTWYAELYYDPEIFDISDATPSLQDCWMGSEEDLDLDVDPVANTISVTVTRKDSEPQSGEGVVVVVEGIVILDDTHGKRHVADAAPFPNPTTGRFELGLPAAAVAEVSLVDVQGRTVNLPARAQQDLTGMPAGMYVLMVRQQDGKLSQERIVLQ